MNMGTFFADNYARSTFNRVSIHPTQNGMMVKLQPKTLRCEGIHDTILE